MFKLSNKISLVLIVAVLVASIFGFASMTHTNMKNCDPASSTSDCPPSQIGMALHHIAAYGGFMQAFVSPVATTIISLILLAMAAIYIFTRRLLLDQDLSFVRIRSRIDSESFLSQLRKISHWLSMFENSPSIYAQH